MPTTRRLAAIGATLMVLSLATAGCGAGGSPVVPPSTSEAGGAPASDAPGGADGGTGGGAPGNPGSGGGILPVNPTPVQPGGQATIVVAKPGRLNPHPVAPIELQASVDGRHVLVKVSWYSGIAPCSVLDSVAVERAGTTIALTVIEGSDPGDGVCAEIAMLKATIVDLGELDPGTWTITAPKGDAAPVVLTIA